ncbi:MAG: transporter substrate-binding domain-containing protein [Magnetococcales bacterium]|nr:transporter substrate-binding domain-containing protein [Magnetococcales bacterium]
MGKSMVKGEGLRSTRWLLLSGFLVTTSLLAGLAQANEQLSVVTSNSNPVYTNPQGTGLVDRLAQTLFARLGWRIRFSHLPSERALINANEGLDDAELLRVSDQFIAQNYPNLVIVPEPWMQKEFIAFTNQDRVIIQQWSDLANFAVAFIKGWRMFEEHAQDFQYLTKVTDEEQLFRLLTNNRTEIILFDRLQGRYYTGKNSIKGIRELESTLVVKNLYMYLNKKHAALVMPIANTLREMKIDGTHKLLLEQGMKELSE